MNLNLKTTLTTLFASSIVLANVTAAKLAAIPLPGLGEVVVPAGFIAFGVAFVCSDLLVEFYGEGYAAAVLYGTVVALGVGYGLIWAAIALPPAPFFEPGAYNQTLGQSSAIVVASVVTIAASQRFDVWLFDRLRTWTDGRHRWVRNCVSTGTSQILDTVVFITLAFAVFPALQGGDPLLGRALVMTIIGQYAAKLVVAAADTPVFYAVTEIADSRWMDR
jgi:uncharacterized integral membrane protein (TIGR00697 family)